MEQSTILFVDDQEIILDALKRAFLNEPYEKIFALSGKNALEILEKKQVHVIITDLGMPEMNGHQLLKIVKERYPRTVRIALSAQSDITTLLSTVNEYKVFKFIPKPWKLKEELKPAIRDAIEYYNYKAAETAKQMVSTD